jgi:aminotransferase
MHISKREQDLPDAVIGKMLKIAVEDKSIISLAPGEPDFSLPKPLINHIPKLANKSNHYSPPGGLKELREAITKKLRKDNKIKTDPNNIIVTCGSTEAILLATACNLDISDRILIPDPSFLGYLPTFELFNAVPVSVPVLEENNFEFDPDELKKYVPKNMKKKTKGLMLCTPGNPTGTIFSKKVLEEVADFAVDNDLFIYSDEAYEKLVYEKKHISIGSFNGMEDRVVTFQTFSKTYAMCGFRVGYCQGPSNLIEAMKKTHIYSTLAAPTISQKLAIKALSLPESHTNKMKTEYKRRRDMITKRLNELNLRTIKPQGAFYTFSNIQEYSKNSFKFSNNILQKAKVAVMPGAEFGKNGEGYIRCSYATDYNLIGKAMDRLEKYLKTKKI